MKIIVTEEHVSEAKALLKNNAAAYDICESCPTALALREQDKQAWRVNGPKAYVGTPLEPASEHNCSQELQHEVDRFTSWFEFTPGEYELTPV